MRGMRITGEEFQKMLHVNDRCLLAHLVLESVTPEVIKTYEDKKALEIVLTINGIEVDVMPFLKMFEDQYREQTAISAKKMYKERVDEILKPYDEASETFQSLWEHMQDEVNDVVSKATDVSWLFDDEEEPEGYQEDVEAGVVDQIPEDQNRIRFVRDLQ